MTFLLTSCCLEGTSIASAASRHIWKTAVGENPLCWIFFSLGDALCEERSASCKEKRSGGPGQNILMRRDIQDPVKQKTQKPPSVMCHKWWWDLNCALFLTYLCCSTRSQGAEILEVFLIWIVAFAKDIFLKPLAELLKIIWLLRQIMRKTLSREL